MIGIPGRFGSQAVVQQFITRPAAIERKAVTQRLVFRRPHFERLLFSIADAQIIEKSTKRPAANGHERTFDQLR